MMSTVVRTAQAHDVALVRAILQSGGPALSLATDPLCTSGQALLQAIETTLRDFPFLLAFDKGQCQGFAYARPHCAGAYRWSADVALHIIPNAPAGTAERLYRQVLGDLKAQGYLAAYALVSPAGPHAVALHQGLGFERIGAHHCIDLQQDADCWCLSLSDDHPAAEPMPYQALMQGRGNPVAS